MSFWSDRCPGAGEINSRTGGAGAVRDDGLVDAGGRVGSKREDLHPPARHRPGVLAPQPDLSRRHYARFIFAMTVAGPPPSQRA